MYAYHAEYAFMSAKDAQLYTAVLLPGEGKFIEMKTYQTQ